MHARISGLADYLADDELDAIRIGREIVADLNWRKLGSGPADRRSSEPRARPRASCWASAPADLKVPFDPREVIARDRRRLARFDEFKPLYGTTLVTGWASHPRLPGRHPRQPQGVLFSEEAKKATQFIQLANQIDTPLVFLQNTTGYMVGKRVRAGRHHQARRQDDQRGHQQHGAAPHAS